MSTALRTLLLATMLLGFATPAEAKLKVVASVGDLAAIARDVGGDAVEVQVLAKPTQDPHFVDARPNLVLALSKADLLVYVGMDLEVGWLPTLVTSSRNSAIQPGGPGSLDASTLITALEVPNAPVDRSMGDIHPGGNPHYTKDPRNGLKVARGIAARLQKLDAANAEKYGQNLARFEKTLEEKRAAWEASLSPFKGAPVVTFHKSWTYFTDWAGLVPVAFIEPKPGLPPSSGHVAQVMGVMKSKGVRLILQEDWYPSQVSALLAEKAGARLVKVSGMTPEGKSYVEHLDTLVRATVQASSAT